MKTLNVQIPAADGFLLSSIVLQPEGASKGIVQFHPGTLTPKEFYLPYCTFLAERGYAVILFDYRGIGKSRPPSLKKFNASITDWGYLDMVGILDWSQGEFPGAQKYIVAHSMGGQIIGLMNNHALLDGIITIASSYGNWKNYTGVVHKYGSGLMWLIYLSWAPKVFGYLPVKKIGMGEDLPKGVSDQLWRWWLHNYPHSTIMDKAGNPHYYHEIRKPFKAYFIEDDTVATQKTIRLYTNDFNNTSIDIEIIKPRELGVDKIGHYGFFNEMFKQTLWKKSVEWLDELSLRQN